MWCGCVLAVRVQHVCGYTWCVLCGVCGEHVVLVSVDMCSVYMGVGDGIYRNAVCGGVYTSVCGTGSVVCVVCIGVWCVYVWGCVGSVVCAACVWQAYDVCKGWCVYAVCVVEIWNVYV